VKTRRVCCWGLEFLVVLGLGFVVGVFLGFFWGIVWLVGRVFWWEVVFVFFFVVW